MTVGSVRLAPAMAAASEPASASATAAAATKQQPQQQQTSVDTIRIDGPIINSFIRIMALSEDGDEETAKAVNDLIKVSLDSDQGTNCSGFWVFQGRAHDGD